MGSKAFEIFVALCSDTLHATVAPLSLSSARHPAGVDKSFSGCQPINRYFIIQSRRSESGRARAGFSSSTHPPPVSFALFIVDIADPPPSFFGCKLRNITRARHCGRCVTFLVSMIIRRYLSITRTREKDEERRGRERERKHETNRRTSLVQRLTRLLRAAPISKL